MNILILTAKFSLDESSPYLTNELADALTDKKCNVTIILVDWAASNNISYEERLVSDSNQKVIIISPFKINSPIKILNTLLKWSLTSIIMRQRFNQVIKKETFDSLISFSPSTIMAGFILGKRSYFPKKKILIQWDFFPFHHSQIGLINSRLVKLIATQVENLTMRCFDWIGCMSPKNIEYLRSHYTIGKHQKVSILPIWTRVKEQIIVDRTNTRNKYNLSVNSSIAIFGGQLVEGRGIDDIINVARFCADNQVNVQIVIVGSGFLWDSLVSISKDLFPSLVLIPAVSRSDYRELLSAADMGIIATVKNVDVPTFPSKCLDYMAAALPIVASVESSTDFKEFIMDNKCGLVSEAGNVTKFAENIVFLSNNCNEARTLGANGRSTLCNQMDVNLIADKIVRFISKNNS